MKKFEDNPLDPGDDPTGNPLGNYKIEVSEDIKNLPVKIQCTWANCFTEPVWDRGLCIRSYDKYVLQRNNATNTGIIGALTGNYHVAADDEIWLESKLNYTNRRTVGWFRESDIWHEKKGTIDPNPGEDNKKKKINWLTWLVTGASILKIVS